MRGRVVARLALTAAVLLGGLSSAPAEEPYPNRAIRIIVAFSAGSGNDVIARELARLMPESLGQSVFVENRLGGGGIIATDVVAKAPPDGYTVGLGTSSQLVMNIALNKTLPFDVEKDLAMIGLISRTNMSLLASKDGPGSVQEIITRSKAKPGSITYGSGGPGSISHIVGETMARRAGIEMMHVPYKGNAAAMTDLAGGRIDLVFDALTSAMALKGLVKIVAISGAKRHPDAPEVPTFAEAGLPGYEAYTWNCLFVPAGTPQPIIDKLNAALNKALAVASVHEITRRNGGEIIGPSTPAEAAAFGTKERAQWLPIVREMNIAH
jgi:tripartite-type tricarboxylate transporter receptor subunit TctC